MSDERNLPGELTRLRAAYAAHLPRRVADLAAAAQAIDAGPMGVHDALRRLRHLAHKLSGSGETYGYKRIGGHARRLEDFAQHMLGLDASTIGNPNFAVRRRVRTLVAELEVMAREAALAADDKAFEVVAPGVEETRVLALLEPDPDRAARAAHALENFGFDVAAVEDIEALAGVLSKSRPAAVVANAGAEGGEMFAGLAALRESGVLVKPLVVMSGRRDFAARLAAARAGCAAFVVDTGDVTAVVSALDGLLNHRDAEPYRVMIADDDLSTARFAEVVLQGAGMTTAVVSDPDEILERMESFAPELLLLDVYMPACTGPEIAAVIRQQEAYSALSIIYLSGEADAARQLAALKAGGDDFLTKPITPDSLITAARAGARAFRRLRGLMSHDAMTGLINYSTMHRTLGLEFARAQRTREPMAFARIDIDRLKRVNESHGREVGDSVIRSLAQILRQRLRRTDVVGRISGEQFGAILPGTLADNAVPIFEQIRAAFAEIDHLSPAGSFRVTFSCGVAAVPGIGDAPALSDAAGNALALAKSSGGNRVILKR